MTSRGLHLKSAQYLSIYQPLMIFLLKHDFKIYNSVFNLTKRFNTGFCHEVLSSQQYVTGKKKEMKIQVIPKIQHQRITNSPITNLYKKLVGILRKYMITQCKMNIKQLINSMKRITFSKIQNTQLHFGAAHYVLRASK